MNKKVCFILPYFGKFNNYFNLWLLSCKYNPNIHWYIFTDDKRTFDYPENVFVKYCTFNDIQKRIYKLFGENIILNKPYDLCKYRVAYNQIFNEITHNYDYWGYCDCDLIWGDLLSTLAPAFDKEYPKISWKGHMTLFLNIPKLENVYKTQLPDCPTFEDCISIGEKTRYNLFDEVGINKIFDKLKIPIYKDLLFADLKVKSKNFFCNHFSEKEKIKNKNQIFVWDTGKLFRLYLLGDQIHKEEFTYIHFLRRHMENCISTKDIKAFMIIPNKFVQYENPTKEYILMNSQDSFYWMYYKQRLNIKYLIKLLKNKVLRKKLLPDEYLHVIK